MLPKFLQPLHSVAKPHLVLGPAVCNAVIHTTAVFGDGYAEPLELAASAIDVPNDGFKLWYPFCEQREERHPEWISKTCFYVWLLVLFPF